MRIRPLRAAATALVASSLVLLTACEGSADAESKGEAKKTPAAKSATPTPKPDVKPFTQRQVQSALLEVKDLPTGWSKDAELSEGDAAGSGFRMGKSDKAECQFLLDSAVGAEGGPKPQNSGALGFTKSQEGPILMAGVTAFTEAEAKKLMEMPPVPAACRKFTAKLEGEEGKSTLVHEDLSVPQRGASSTGIRLRVTSADPEMPSMQYDLAQARVGGAIVTVAEMSFLKADIQAFEDGFAKAVAKAERVAKEGPEGKKV
ncbi:hypothetical protein OG897_07520 [Streptomyces sp. NBC_00237]|uniref:hypothetical protein n=1 Tax=Streptomyces sp. NBC_00237 TaxID=2975687 RepID=UPI002255480F|nr:hypothetical protein [Streptomyces sp. NBC_00237]MCX5201303.1 hypothetical protein [Streptomyces sp. NBC_00237]